MCGCMICGTLMLRLLLCRGRACPRSERSSDTASPRQRSDTPISLIVRSRRLLLKSVRRSFHFPSRRRVTMPVPENDAALIMLREVSIALAGELDQHYSHDELHRGDPFEKAVLLGQIMLLLRSSGFAVPAQVEKLGRKVAGVGK